MATTTVSETQSQVSMTHRLPLGIASPVALGLCLALAGCARAPSEAPAAAPPPVTVSYPVEREVTDYADFTARTAAVDSVELRARVSGYLDRVNFKDGALVQKGGVLFEIDPRTYRALLDQALAKVSQGEARLAYDEAEYRRNLTLVSSGAVTRSELDKSLAARGVDVADIAAAKAEVKSRELDVNFATVSSVTRPALPPERSRPSSLLHTDESRRGPIRVTRSLRKY